MPDVPPGSRSWLSNLVPLFVVFGEMMRVRLVLTRIFKDCKLGTHALIRATEHSAIDQMVKLA